MMLIYLFMKYTMFEKTSYISLRHDLRYTIRYCIEIMIDLHQYPYSLLLYNAIWFNSEHFLGLIVSHGLKFTFTEC